MIALEETQTERYGQGKDEEVGEGPEVVATWSRYKNQGNIKAIIIGSLFFLLCLFAGLTAIILNWE